MAKAVGRQAGQQAGPTGAALRRHAEGVLEPNPGRSERVQGGGAHRIYAITAQVAAQVMAGDQNDVWRFQRVQNAPFRIPHRLLWPSSVYFSKSCFSPKRPFLRSTFSLSKQAQALGDR